MISLFRPAVALAACIVCVSAGLVAAEKPKITSQDDIPRFEYDLDVKATDILTDPVAYQNLADRVQLDLEKLIDENDIEDRSTLQGILSTLMLIDLQKGEHASALKRLAMVRELEAKPANKLTTRVLMESVIAARAKDYATDDAYRAAFAKIYAEKINALPERVAVMQTYIDANHVEKADIWADRNVTLEDSADLHPVTVAIWDSGIDNAIFEPMGKV